MVPPLPTLIVHSVVHFALASLHMLGEPDKEAFKQNIKQCSLILSLPMQHIQQTS
jgi:hypothetical protein